MRRARAVLAASSAVGLAIALPAVAGGPSPTPDPEAPITVFLQQILPRSPQPGGVVEVLGTLRNVGSRPVTDLRVRLQVGQLVSTRSALEAADQDRPPTYLRVSVQPRLTELAPGQSTSFDVRTTVATLQLSHLGVFPLDVVARGNAGDGIDSLGLSPTWLPFFGDGTPRPTRVAVLWPLVDRPHLRPDGTFVDDALAPALAPTGRLGRLLDAARTALVPACGPRAFGPDGRAQAAPTRCLPVPVTLAVDPDLLDTAELMTSPYTVGKSKGSGTPAVSGWLQALRSVATPERVLGLPYADPDVSAVAQDPRTKDDVGNASALGSEVVTRVLGTPGIAGVAWPPAGPVTQAAADVLAVGGAHAFVLDPSAYNANGVPLNPTPGTRSLFTTSATGRELVGLVTDSTLSDLLTLTSPYGPRVAEQRFLAETAILAAEEPGVSRTFVLAPARRTNASAASGEDLRDLGRVPWLCPVLLADVVAGSERCPDQNSRPAPPTNRGDLRTDTTGQLSRSFLSGVAADRDVATQLTDAVATGDPAWSSQVAALKAHLRRAVARAESSAGREDPMIARSTASELHAEVAHLTGEVVIRSGRSLLTSQQGTLSVSLENTLPVAVQVRVRFTSKTATLSNAETGLVTVQPGHAVQASVRAQAQRSGQFVVFAQVVDRNGKAFGPESEIIVRSTRFGRVALAVTFAAAGVLLVAAGFRIIRRARAGRR